MITTSLAVPVLADEASTAKAGSAGTATSEPSAGTTTPEPGAGTTTPEPGAGTTTSEPGAGTATSESGKEGQETKAAKIGETEYATLAQAFAAVGENETTITLLKDVTESVTVAVGKKITLDLNRKNITVTKGCAIVNKGTLKVCGSGVVSASEKGSAAVANFPDADVTLNGGTFISANWYVIKNLGVMTIDGNVTVKKPDDCADTSSLIDNGWYGSTDTVAGEKVAAVANKASLTIKSGSFEGKSGSKSCSVVKNDDYGTLNISGGTFDSTNNTGAENATTILNWNVATISGGTFKGQYPLSVGAYTGDADKGQLTVTDGTFIGVTSIFGKGIGGNGEGAVTVSGGTFTTTGEGSAFATDDIDTVGGYTISITNGEFGGKLTAESITPFCASGFVPVADKDGKLTIKNNNKVKIGNNFYLDLQDALAAAENDAEIVLVDDIEYPAADAEKEVAAFAGYIVDKADNFNVSINGNGHKIITNVTGDKTPQIGIKSKNGSLEVHDVVVPNNLLFTVDGAGGGSLYVWNCTFNGSNKGTAPNVRIISYDDNKFEPTDENAEPLSYTDMGSTNIFEFHSNTVTAKKSISLSGLKDGEEQKWVYFENNKITNKNGAAIVLEAANDENAAFTGEVYVENNSVDAQTAILLKNPTKMTKTTGTGTEAATSTVTIAGSAKDNEVKGTFIDYDKSGLTEEADKTAAKDAFDSINDNSVVFEDERPVLNAPYDKLNNKRFNASVLKKDGKDGVILTKPDKYKDDASVVIMVGTPKENGMDWQEYDGKGIKLTADIDNEVYAKLCTVGEDNAKTEIPYSEFYYIFYPVTLKDVPETSLYQDSQKTTEYKSGTEYTLVNEYTADDPDSKVILFYTTDGSDPTKSTARKAYNGEKLKINDDVTVKTVYMSPCLSCEKCSNGKYAECENPVYGEVGEYKYTVPGSSDKAGGITRRGSSSSVKGRTYTKDIFGVEHKSHTAYIKGYSDGTVRPNETITREEIAEILYRISNDAAFITAGGNKFSDVAADRWSAAAIEFMTEKGVITGYEDGSFRPSDNLTRAEFAALVSRFANLYNGGEITKYKDVDDTLWAYRSIMALTNAKLMNGYEDGSFRPENNITRAEVMTVINKILGRYPNAEYIKTQKLNRFSDLNENDWYYSAVVEATTTHEYYLTNGTETSWENVK